MPPPIAADLRPCADKGNGEERYRSSPLPKRASKTWQNIVICLVKTTQPTGELELCKQTKLSLATVWT